MQTPPGSAPVLAQVAAGEITGVVKDPANNDEVVQKRAQAFVRSYQTRDKIPTGIFAWISDPEGNIVGLLKKG